MTVTDKIFKLLKSQGKTQKELADFLNTGTSTITGWKQENRNPSVNLIMPICEFFGVTPEFLLKEDEENDMKIIGQEHNSIPKKGEIVLLAKAYGGKTEIITLSEEDFEASKPLLERLRREYEEEHVKPKKRRKHKGDKEIW